MPDLRLPKRRDWLLSAAFIVGMALLLGGSVYWLANYADEPLTREQAKLRHR